MKYFKYLAMLMLSATLVLTACGDDQGPASSVFLNKSTIEPGDQCANGGVQIDMGFDSNGNNVLDTSEITSTEYICNGVDYDPGVSVTGVSLNSNSETVDVGDTVQLTATVAPVDATNQGITWLSSDPGVATVSTSGLVTAESVGVVAVFVFTKDGMYTDTCMVTVAPAIGSSFQGGVVAYIFQPGDPGYVAGEVHGLIAAETDQSTGIIWAVSAYQSERVPFGTGTALGTGMDNTNNIIFQNGAGTTYAAGLVRAYNGGGYTDWYLPSKDELNKLYISRVAIGGFADGWYWSSSEDDAYVAWLPNFNDGLQYIGVKSNTYRVRAVRAF